MRVLQRDGDRQQHEHCFFTSENKLRSEVSASNGSLMQAVLSHFALQYIKSRQGEEIPGSEG